eukprot:gene5811-9030_t
MANIILDNLNPDDIIYIHTDGFVSAQPLNQNVLGDKL